MIIVQSIQCLFLHTLRPLYIVYSVVMDWCEYIQYICVVFINHIFDEILFDAKELSLYSQAHGLIIIIVTSKNSNHMMYLFIIDH